MNSKKNVFQRLYDDTDKRKYNSRKDFGIKASSHNKSASMMRTNNWIIYQKFIGEFDEILWKVQQEIDLDKNKDKLFGMEITKEILLRLGFVRIEI